jgi:succinylarginine dihydrolase
VHLTVANLNNKFHRSLEAPTTEALLRAIFRDENSLRSTVRYPRLRFSMKGRQTITASVEITATPAYSYLFTVVKKAIQPKRYPARQSREASEAVARLNQVNPHQRILLSKTRTLSILACFITM